MKRRRLLRLLPVIVLMLPAACAGTGPIFLSCKGADQTDAAIVTELCVTLETALAEHYPDRTVQRVDASRSAAATAGNITLEVTRTGPYLCKARLVWETAATGGIASQTEGPLAQISAMDRPLGQGWHERFVRDLLKVSEIRIDRTGANPDNYGQFKLKALPGER